MQELRGRLNTYRLEIVVARGRSGEVFRGLDADQRPVAIKLFDSVAEFECEIAALDATRSDHVVRLIESGGRADGRRWMATAWVEGRTLAHVLATEGPLSGERAHRLVAQLADAVDAVNDAGFVHGDVSPRNVMVDLHDQVTLIDLAASRRVGAVGGDVDVTTSIEVEATPRYCSPEVAAGTPASPASDRYAVGLIAYESITGAFPFPDVATPIAMLAHHATTVPLAPSEHRPRLSTSVDEILLRSLHKSPEQRPLRAAEIAAGLLDADEGRRSATSTRRRPLAAVAALLVLGCAAGISAMVLRSELSTQPDAVEPDAVEPDGMTVIELPDSIVELDASGPSGRARGIACNLLAFADFEQATSPAHFYAGDITNTVVVNDQAGVAGSRGLEIGADGSFGIFGEVVPIDQLTGSVAGHRSPTACGPGSRAPRPKRESMSIT